MQEITFNMPRRWGRNTETVTRKFGFVVAMLHARLQNDMNMK